MSLVGSASSIPHRETPYGAGCTDGVRGGEAEPTRPTRDWRIAFAEAHRAWARKFAPWLLQEWLA